MITVQVTYKVKSAFAAENQQNINAFLQSFQQLNKDEFQYDVFVKKDGQTFVHLSRYKNEAIQAQLLSDPVFKSFQQQRDASGLEGEPTIEWLTIVGSSQNLSMMPS
jgi:hypothetical protein